MGHARATTADERECTHQVPHAYEDPGEIGCNCSHEYVLINLKTEMKQHINKAYFILRTYEFVLNIEPILCP